MDLLRYYISTVGLHNAELELFSLLRCVFLLEYRITFFYLVQDR